jgi:hypothetical protein
MSLEQKEYTFEPIEFSDFTIIYQEANFRVHKYVLVKYSSYFAALLKGNITTNEITLPPILAHVGHSGWLSTDMHAWLMCVYRDAPLTIEDVTHHEPEKSDGQEDFALSPLCDFNQYFGCSKLETQLRFLCGAVIEFESTHTTRFIIVHLRRLEAAQWHDLVDKYVQIAGNNLKAIDYHEVSWNLLSTDVQGRILQIASEKNKL